MRFLVLSPHRDDAAFSLGLSIRHWLGGRHRVEVLNCFTESEYAPFSDVENLHPNDRRSFATAVRRREDVAWNKLLGGAVRITDLDLLDAPVRLACAVEEVLTAEVRAGDRALARVAGALRKWADKADPRGAAVLAPLGLGGHIDHRVVRQATLEVLEGREMPLAFYEDLPYALHAPAEEAAAATGLALQPVWPAPEAADPGEAVAAKFRMAQCYDSQITEATARAIAEFSRSDGGRERVWANAAWRAMASA